MPHCRVPCLCASGATAFGEAGGHLEERAITSALREQLSNMSLLFSAFVQEPCVGYRCFICQRENNQPKTGHGSGVWGHGQPNSTEPAWEHLACVAASARRFPTLGG